MVKKILLFILFLSLSFSPVLAKGWQDMSNKNFKKVNIEIKKDAIHRNENYAFYTVHFKNKQIGDYINVIATNCSDFSTSVILTTEYDEKFLPIYENYSVDYSKLMPIDKTSMLYDSAVYACTSKETYVKPVGNNGDSTAKKVAKGIGQAVAFIIVAPIAVAAAIIGAL